MFRLCGVPVGVDSAVADARELGNAAARLSNSPCEGSAIIAVVQRNFGVKRSELPAAVARWMGFSSTSAAMRELIEGELESAMCAGWLRQQSETIEVG